VAIQVRETDAPMLGFLARHGFVERDRMFESVLDLTRFEPDAFADALRSAASKQIRFVSLAEADTPGLRRRLHQLANALDADVPSTEALEPITYEQWTGGWLGAPHSRPDLIVVGLDGDEPVAVSSIIVTPSGDAINYMSGVAAAYRGRGLGLAVKVEALRRAKAAGITEVLTENHTRNGPMLAINERLGYRRLPALIEFARQPRGRIGQQ
jgi:ribosomal protein S18 acetylase RimI-like enzyme